MPQPQARRGARRVRTHDPVRVRTALAAQTEVLRGAVRALCAHPRAAELLAAPTRLGAWAVGDLVVHLCLVLEQIPRRLADPVPDGEALSPTALLRRAPTAAADVASWVRRTSEEEAAREEAAREAAAPGGAAPDGPSRGGPDGGRRVPSAARTGERFDAAADAFLALLDGPEAADPQRRFPFRFGPVLLADYLLTRLLELVVHADDLAEALDRAARALGTESPVPVPDAFRHDRQALAALTRLLADTAAEAAPGGAVELRVPPFAVVQCVEGPRHTRGTPPNVVETDPLTWIRLATGRTSWADAVDSGAVSASGERSDLSGLLPVTG
ncbi:sterol carrier family protein [Streptomyces sp. NPDC001380]|uniref:sterol carrier family protein n=1 Tax=Streptomyces sp. NPDC001380 TaxID=3364566 RepID=UPI00368B0941